MDLAHASRRHRSRHRDRLFANRWSKRETEEVKKKKKKKKHGFLGRLGGAPLRGGKLGEETDGSLAEPFNNSKTRSETLAYHERGSSKLIRAPYPWRYRLVLCVHLVSGYKPPPHLLYHMIVNDCRKTVSFRSILTILISVT